VRGSDRITLLQAIAMAGGPSNQADLRHVTIRRFHEPSGRVVSSPFLDIDSTIARNDDRDNLVLEPGDTIVVPEGKELRVQVLGHVERPGSVTWTQGMTLSTAITESGGFKRFAKTDKIKVVRNGVEQLIFDFDEMLEGRMKDLELQPGDVVYVDEKWI
jgi:protein involved in polysaccharide export with SLBB domain